MTSRAQTDVVIARTKDLLEAMNATMVELQEFVETLESETTIWREGASDTDTNAATE